MEIIKEYANTDYFPLIAIWESSVLATHDFLSAEDFLKIKDKISFYLSQVSIYTYTTTDNTISAFLGVSDDMIEMLFVDDSYRGQGIGKLLLDFAVNNLSLNKVDVNEQNTKALYFYEKYGFKKMGYSALDSEGMPYPIIHLQLI